MKKIKLTKGKYALVDDEDFEYLNQWKWHFAKGYAGRSVGDRKNKKYVWMHRLINNTPDGFETDHINRNKSDNRKCNLRTVTKSLNGLNRGKNKNNKSGHKGIYWENQTKKWRAGIGINGKRIKTKRFSNISDAVSARLTIEQEYNLIN